MKIGIAQINTTVGDLQGNSRKIQKSYEELCQKGQVPQFVDDNVASSDCI